MDSSLFFRIVGPSSIVCSAVIILYLLINFLITYYQRGLGFDHYHYRFMGKARTADTLVMLAAIGYGWLRGRNKLRFRWFGFVYLMVGGVGVFLTKDRGGVIAYSVICILLLITDYKRLLIFLSMIAVVMGLSFRIEALNDIKFLFDYLITKQGFDGLKFGSTLDTFKAAWLMIRDHWLLGVGTNNFSAHSTQYNYGNWYAYAHNIVLQFWAENGFFGMLLGLSIIGLVLYRWAKSYRLYQFKSISYGFGVSFIGLLVGQMTNSTIWIISLALPFWLIAGVVNGIYFEVRKTNAA